MGTKQPVAPSRPVTMGLTATQMVTTQIMMMNRAVTTGTRSVIMCMRVII